MGNSHNNLNRILTKFQNVLIEFEQDRPGKQKKLSKRKRKRIIKSMPRIFFSLEAIRLGFKIRSLNNRTIEWSPKNLLRVIEDPLKEFVYNNVCSFLDVILDSTNELSNNNLQDQQKIASYHLILCKYIWDNVKYQQTTISRLLDDNIIGTIEEEKYTKIFQECFDAGLVEFEKLLDISNKELTLLQKELYEEVLLFKEE